MPPELVWHNPCKGGFASLLSKTGKTSSDGDNDGDIEPQNKALPGTGLTDEPLSRSNPPGRWAADKRSRREQGLVEKQQEPEREAK